ncbi:MAG: alpha/beta hydrolase [Verrucomicrobiaceae bacterium]
MALVLLCPVMVLQADLAEKSAALAERLLGENGGNRFFYYPTEKGLYEPGEFGYKYEEVTFKSEDGTKLHGWFLPAHGMKKAKGTVVFSHGNAGAVGYHLGFITWAINGGYNVLLYDYRGYGKSEGEVDRKGIVQDVRAAFAYVKTRSDVDPGRLISFGHSLGGAKSIAALGEKAVEGVRGVISFAGFSSYKEMATKVGGEFGGRMVSDELAPRDYVAKLSPVPLLLVHGQVDAVVPVEQARELFQKAREPKTLLEIEEGGHNGALRMKKDEGVKKVLAWMEKVLNSPKKG